MNYNRGRFGRNQWSQGRGNGNGKHIMNTVTGPPRLESKNPSSDQVSRYLNQMKDYLEGEGNIIKTVFKRTDMSTGLAVETVEKMSLIFGTGTDPGRYPISVEPIDLVHIQNESAVLKEMRIKRWESEYRDHCNHIKGIDLEKSGIAGILKSTINFNVKEIMKKSVEGREALDDELGKPMEIINVLKTTDFSTNAASTLTDNDKYYNSHKKFFNANEFKQQYDESLNAWGKRFKNEINSLKLLATRAGKDTEIPSEVTLANIFLDRLNGLYNKLRDDLEKGIRTPKPTTIDEVINVGIVYDKAPKDNREYDRNYKGAYVIGRGGRSGRSGRGRENNITMGNWKCKIHHTDTHEYWDDTCKKIHEEKVKREEAQLEGAIDGRRQYFANHSGRSNGRFRGGRGRGRGRYRN